MDDREREARLDAWFRDHAPRVLAYLLHRTDAETAHDVLQEVFVLAFRKADSVPEPPLGWLFGTARRVLANTTRGGRRRDRLALRLAEQVPPAPARDRDDGGELAPAVAETLAALSPADREVLTLSAWYDLTPQDAAAALGCSPATYAVRLHRARRRFAERLRAGGYPLDVLRPEVARD